MEQTEMGPTALDAVMFVVYLQAYQPDEVVGKPLDPYACPIAQWVQRGTGAQVVEVSSVEIRVATREAVYEITPPAWVGEFMGYVDYLDADQTLGRTAPVTAQEALTFMQSILEGGSTQC